MERRVFISHAAEDRSEAKTICDGLEKRGVRCWIAPRDIRSGAIWAKSLMEGVAECSEMVLVLSEHANRSDPVISEVHAASSRKRRIIPVRIREVLPEGALEFYIGRAHWFDAFAAPLDSYLGKLAAEISGEATKETEPSAVAANVPRSGDFEKIVQVFFHASNVPQTTIRATEIANLLEAHGWSVSRGYTELEIHSRGVWVHGSTKEQRLFAIRLLAQMGIEARVDDRAEDVPLQIIVGSGEHERRRASGPQQSAGRSSAGSGRIEWATDVRSVSSVPRLAVRMFFVENIGGTPGLSIKVISDEPQTIEGARVTITNILCWSEQHNTFVMSRDIYDSGTDFRPLEIGKVTLHPGEVENAGFIRSEGQRVEFNGTIGNEGQAHYRIRKAGIWQVTFRVQADRDGRNQDGFLCLKWDGGERPGESAIPWKCSAAG